MGGQRKIPVPVDVNAKEAMHVRAADLARVVGLKENSLYKVVREGRLNAQYLKGTPGFLLQPGAVKEFLRRQSAETRATARKEKAQAEARAKREKERRASLEKQLAKARGRLETLEKRLALTSSAP